MISFLYISIRVTISSEQILYNLRILPKDTLYLLFLPPYLLLYYTLSLCWIVQILNK